MNLDGLLHVFRDELHLPDPVGVLAVLAAGAVNLLLPGDPIWLMLVGGSSGGKTLLILSLDRLPRTERTSTFSRAGLLALGRDGQLGGLLRRMGGQLHTAAGVVAVSGGEGLLLVDDFTAMLTGVDALDLVRETFDGKITRDLGSLGGVSLRWEGRLGVVAGCTDAIEEHRAELGTKGERFLYLALRDLDADDRQAVGLHAIGHSQEGRRIRERLAGAVAEFFDQLPTPDSLPPIPAADINRLVAAADLAALARSPVLRDRFNHDVDLVPQAEAPGRLAGSFGQLWRGLHLIGAESVDAWPVVRASTLGCVPNARRAPLLALLDADEPLRTAQVAARVHRPSRTVRRALEDLAAHRVVDLDGDPEDDRSPAWWRISDWTRGRWADAFGESAATSDGGRAGALLTLVRTEPDSLASITGEVRRRGEPGPCRFCGQPAALADAVGPVHLLAPVCMGGTAS